MHINVFYCCGVPGLQVDLLAALTTFRPSSHSAGGGAMGPKGARLRGGKGPEDRWECAGSSVLGHPGPSRAIWDHFGSSRTRLSPCSACWPGNPGPAQPLMPVRSGQSPLQVFRMQHAAANGGAPPPHPACRDQDHAPGSLGARLQELNKRLLQDLNDKLALATSGQQAGAAPAAAAAPAPHRSSNGSAAAGGSFLSPPLPAAGVGGGVAAKAGMGAAAARAGRDAGVAAKAGRGAVTAGKKPVGAPGASRQR